MRQANAHECCLYLKLTGTGKRTDRHAQLSIGMHAHPKKEIITLIIAKYLSKHRPQFSNRKSKTR